MQFVNGFRAGALALVLGTACAIFTAGCSSKSSDATSLGTFRMGEKIQMGSLTYTVLEAQWKPSLTEGGGGKLPKNRYLFVRVSATNGGGASTSIPALVIEGSGNQTYNEVTEGLQDVPEHLGILRTVQPAQTEAGYVIFDAPMTAYKLLISDGGDPGTERYARVDLPVSLE